MTAYSAEIIVVGAGPAGTSAAHLLASMGRDVLLLDQNEFPRDKACGEYVSPGAVRVIRELFPEVAAMLHPVEGMSVSDESGASFSVRFPSGSRAGSVRRTELDFALFNAAVRAGAASQTSARVDDVYAAADGVHLIGRLHGAETQWNSRWLIAADGYHSRIVRALGWNRVLGRRRIARVFHVDCDESSRTQHDTIRMFAGRHGVVGCGPMRGSSNITLVVEEGTSGESPARPADRLLAAERQVYRTMDPGLLMTGQDLGPGLSTACGPRRSHCAAGGRVLVVGDAACFIDPFTGEGIYSAIKGSYLAAAALDGRRSPEATTENYLRSRRHELEKRYRLCDAIRRILANPPARSRAIASLGRRPALAQTLAAAIGDLEPATVVLNPRYLGELIWSCIIPS